MTTIKKEYKILLVCILVAAGIFFSPAGLPHKKKLHYKTFHNELGWGYDIFVNDSIFIHQKMVPGAKKNTGFLKKEQADQTATLVIEKIRSGQVPSITNFELQRIISENN